MEDFFQEDLYTKCSKLIALIESGAGDYDANHAASQMIVLVKEGLASNTAVTKNIDGIGELTCKCHAYTASVMINRTENNSYYLRIYFHLPQTSDKSPKGSYNKVDDYIDIFGEFDKFENDNDEEHDFLSPRQVLDAINADPGIHQVLEHELQHALDDKKYRIYDKKDWNSVKDYCSGIEINARYHVVLRICLKDIASQIATYPMLLSHEGFILIRDWITNLVFNMKDAKHADKMDYLKTHPYIGADKNYSLPKDRELHFQKILDRVRDRASDALLVIKERKRKEIVDNLAKKYADFIKKNRNVMPNVRMYIKNQISPKDPRLADIRPPNEFVDEIIARALELPPSEIPMLKQ